MNRDLKSLCYAFRAEDLEIFTSEDDDCFIASHLICSKCKAFWYTDLAECYLCGEINYNLNVCQYNHYTSQQSSTKQCHICKKSTEKKCINKKCSSNTNEYIKNISKKKRKQGQRGVFERKKSSFRISQLHCIKCGNIENIYKHFQVYLVDYDPKTVKTNISNVTEDDLVIVKNKTVRITEPLTPVIEYAYYLGNKSPDWIPVWTDLPAIINEVFS